VKKYSTKEVSVFGNAGIGYLCEDPNCCGWYNAGDVQQEIKATAGLRANLEDAQRYTRDLEQKLAQTRGAVGIVSRGLHTFKNGQMLRHVPASNDVLVSVEYMQTLYDATLRNGNPFDQGIMQQMYSFKDGGAFRFDPKTHTVQVSLETMSELYDIKRAHSKPQVLYQYPGQVLPFNPVRDTIEVTRSLWEMIQRDLDKLKAFRFRVADALKLEEGADIVETVRITKRDLGYAQAQIDSLEADVDDLNDEVSELQTTKNNQALTILGLTKALKDINTITWRSRTPAEAFLPWRDYAANRFREIIKVIDGVNTKPTTGETNARFEADIAFNAVYAAALKSKR
jgi:hypothetical protein